MWATLIRPTSAHTAYGRAQLSVRDAGTDGIEILVQGLGPNEANVDRLIWRGQHGSGLNLRGAGVPVVWTRTQCPVQGEGEDLR